MGISNEESNAFKFGKILLECGTEVLKYQTIELIKQQGYDDIKTFFNCNYEDIKKNCNLYLVYKKIKPDVDNLNEFDITLTYSIIQYILTDNKFPNNSPNVNEREKLKEEAMKNMGSKRYDCYQIKELRNQFYGHLVIFKISDNDFDENIEKLKSLILNLCNEGEKTKFEEKINQICAMNLTDSSEIESIKEEFLLQSIRNREHFKLFLDSALSNIGDTQTDLRKSLDQVTDTFDQKIVELNKLMKELRSIISNEQRNQILKDFSKKMKEPTSVTKTLSCKFECSW